MTSVSSVLNRLPLARTDFSSKEDHEKFSFCPKGILPVSLVFLSKDKPSFLQKKLDIIQGGMQPLSNIMKQNEQTKSQLYYLKRIKEMNRKWINQSPNEAEKETREIVAKKIEDCFFNKKEELNLSYNTLHLLFSASCQLTSLPPMIGALFHLKKLNVSGHLLTALPKKTSYLKTLEELNLNNNYFEKFPEEITHLKTLKKLEICDNKLEKLSKNIINLENLKNISLEKNYFTKMPQEICEISHLKKLNLNGNLLSELPQTFSKLQKLETLSLMHNKFIEFPEVILEISHLKKLFLDDNKMKELPENIDKLSELKALGFSMNKLTHIPNNFSKLSKLEILDLLSNKLPDNHSKELPQLKGFLSRYYKRHGKNKYPLSKSWLGGNRLFYAWHFYDRALADRRQNYAKSKNM